MVGVLSSTTFERTRISAYLDLTAGVFVLGEYKNVTAGPDVSR